jgi:CubicO group peptidase (beta-lactamase class C family)
LFRIGSASKLFTWTAVMQLAEQGKLDLDADVNTYLDFEIPATYPEPITMKHLMSHTPGFEDLNFEIQAPSSEQGVPLGEWLATHIPARVRRPGELTAYSNYGTALAGYIVESIAGMPFEQYAQENILAPLGMTQTTAYQPLPPELAPNLATGYFYANGDYQAQKFEHFNIGPAGSMSASGTDIAKFMLMHLQNGSYGEAQILQPDTIQQMHSTLFTHDPRFNGMTYGFIEGDQNGQHILWHAGSTNFLKTNLVLLPEHNVGIFVSGNSIGADELRHDLPEAFIDRYYPASESQEAPTLSDLDLSRFVGTYRRTRSSYTTLEKAFFILAQPTISAQDGLLVFEGQEFAPIEPLVFQEVGGHDKLFFRQDEHGNITHAFFNNWPIWAYEKRTGIHTSDFQLGLVLPGLAIFLLALVIWPVGYFVNRRRGNTQPRLANVARWLSAAMIVLNLLFLVGLVTVLLSPLTIMVGNVAPQRVILAVGSLAALLALGTLIFVGLAWKQRYWSVWGRIYYTLVTLAGLAFAWWLNYWNLIGWKF